MSDEAAAEYVAPGSLKPWGKNPRKNDPAVIEVANAIKRFGFGAPIVARRETREIIAGHTRWKAAQKLGLERVPVRFLDLDEQEAHALALADNKLGEIATWDDAAVAEIMRDLHADEVSVQGLGWDTDEIAAMLTGDVGGESDGNEAPEVPETPTSKLGEVYQLGPHRLVCGDSTSAEAWAALLPDGEKLQMVWTDPPYGVAVNDVSPEEAKRLHRRTDGLIVQNDDLDEAGLRALLDGSLGRAASACEPGAAWYVAAPAGPLFGVFGAALVALGVWRHTLIWAKDVFAFGRSDYHYRHEPIFYGWIPGAAHYFVDDRTKDTVFEVPRPKKSVEHPTMKPVDLVREMIRNSSKPGWIVGEPFGGSGTTMIAAACEGRIARLIELDPRYCDVIRRRWARWARENGAEVGDGLDG